MSKQQKQTSGPEKLYEKNSETSFVKKTWEEERFKGTWMWKGKELLRSGRNKQKKTLNALIHVLSGNMVYMNGFPICFVTLPLTAFSSHSPNWKKLVYFKTYQMQAEQQD